MERSMYDHATDCRESCPTCAQNGAQLRNGPPLQKSCARSIELLKWYTQVPGDHLSVSMCPHRRRWTGGFDAAALLRTKSLFTTVLSMPHVQIVIVALGLLQTGFGLHSLAAKMRTVPSAHCAKVGVSLRREHRQIPVHASGWHFGLLLNGCKVPGGKRSATDTTQVLTFTDNVDFNGFYLTPTAI